MLVILSLLFFLLFSAAEINDCLTILAYHVPSSSNDDVYLATVDGQSMNIRCDMTTAGGGWTVGFRFHNLLVSR